MSSLCCRVLLLFCVFRSSGSPASRGLLQFDLWGSPRPAGGRWDWSALKARLAVSGMRNSLLMAPMPTATTAQILGNNESTEPFTSNMYNRRVLAGEFPVRDMIRHVMMRVQRFICLFK